MLGRDLGHCPVPELALVLGCPGSSLIHNQQLCTMHVLFFLNYILYFKTESLTERHKEVSNLSH